MQRYDLYVRTSAYGATYHTSVIHFKTVCSKRPATPLTLLGSSCARVKSTAVLSEKATLSLQKYWLR